MTKHLTEKFDDCGTVSDVYGKARPGNSYRPVGWSGDEEVRENNLKGMELTSNRAE